MRPEHSLPSLLKWLLASCGLFTAVTAPRSAGTTSSSAPSDRQERRRNYQCLARDAEKVTQPAGVLLDDDTLRQFGLHVGSIQVEDLLQFHHALIRSGAGRRFEERGH
jgi:hypothetical protein